MSDSAPLLSTRIGDLAARWPGAVAVFRSFGLDFCCGGERTLSEAIAAAHAPSDRVLDALTVSMPAVLDDGAAWTDASTGALIEHIKTRYHLVHLQELPQLHDLAAKVEVVHRDNPNVPAGLHDVLARLTAEVRVHQQREEVVLFPMLLQGGGALAASAIQVMRAEHDNHGAALELIDEITNNRTAPAEACTTWRALYLGLTKLRDDMMMHVHLENNVLFPRYEHPEGQNNGNSVQRRDR